MKKIPFLLSIALALFVVSCNNQPKPAEDKTAQPEPVKAPEPKAAFTPYKAMMVEFTVKDFDKWAKAFAANDSLRKANGISESYAAHGSAENDKLVIVFNKVADMQKAKDFAGSQVREEAMKKAGVTGKATTTFVDVLRDDTSTIPQKERVMVTHHVKDFDTWLKAYDGEGKAAREANGLIDRGLTRGIDDPNTVSILFAISDEAKAKARIASPELKKLMTDAGVDGPPHIVYFKWVD